MGAVSGNCTYLRLANHGELVRPWAAPEAGVGRAGEDANWLSARQTCKLADSEPSFAGSAINAVCMTAEDSSPRHGECERVRCCADQGRAWAGVSQWWRKLRSRFHRQVPQDSSRANSSESPRSITDSKWLRTETDAHNDEIIFLSRGQDQGNRQLGRGGESDDQYDTSLGKPCLRYPDPSLRCVREEGCLHTPQLRRSRRWPSPSV